MNMVFRIVKWGFRSGFDARRVCRAVEGEVTPPPGPGVSTPPAAGFATNPWVSLTLNRSSFSCARIIGIFGKIFPKKSQNGRFWERIAARHFTWLRIGHPDPHPSSWAVLKLNPGFKYFPCSQYPPPPMLMKRSLAPVQGPHPTPFPPPLSHHLPPPPRV